MRTVKEAVESLDELRCAYADLRVLLATSPSSEIRAVVRRFGVAMASFEQATGLDAPEGAGSDRIEIRQPAAGKQLLEGDEVVKGLWRIGDELHKLGVILREKHYDQVRSGAGPGR